VSYSLGITPYKETIIGLCKYIALLLLFLGKAMIIKRFSTSVVVYETLAEGLEFRFEGEVYGGRYLLNFTINNQTDPSVGEGYSVQTMRIVLKIWKSFSKYPCMCCGASGYHHNMWKKLGFIESDTEGILIYNP
jgi:hypothetical protein